MAKRVSSDEKLDRIARFFRATPEIYCLKDLERMIPKACDISSMKLLEFLKSAVDEDLIHVEKCGSSNIYWSFKNERHHFYACEAEKTLSGIEAYQEENAGKRSHLEGIRAARTESEERRELKERYARCKDEVTRIEELRRNSIAHSYSAFEEMVEEAKKLKAEVNKTTDDMFTLRGFVCDKFGLDKREFDRNFGIVDRMDYIE